MAGVDEGPLQEWQRTRMAAVVDDVLVGNAWYSDRWVAEEEKESNEDADADGVARAARKGREQIEVAAREFVIESSVRR